MIRKIFIGVIAFSFLVSCDRIKQRAASNYFSSVIDRTDTVVTCYNEFIRAYNMGQRDSMRLMATLLEKTATEQEKALNKMDDWNSETNFRTISLEYIKQLKNIGAHDFKELLKLYQTPDSLLTNDDYLKMDSISHLMDTKIDAASKPFLKAQADFAKKNNMKLNFDFELDSTQKREIDTTVLLK